jgi:cytoskeletal protein RodZ
VSSSPYRSCRLRALAGVGIAGLVLLVGACTPAPADQAQPGSSAPGSNPSGSTPSAGSTTSSGAGGSSVSPSASSSAATLTIDITIADHQVNPNAEKIDVARGTTVTLKVTSDADDEIHAHTAGDGYELEVKAGQPTSGSFVASDVGSFEVESHHLDKVIAILNVR